MKVICFVDYSAHRICQKPMLQFSLLNELNERQLVSQESVQQRGVCIFLIELGKVNTYVRVSCLFRHHHHP